MKKILLCMASVAFASSLYATSLLSDSFAYSPGQLNSQGMWVLNGTAGSSPILVTEGSLTFAGYQDEEAGNSVSLKIDNSSESAQAIFAPKGTDAPTDVYYSALVRVDALPTVSRVLSFFFLTGTSEFSGKFGDGEASSEGGGLFAMQGSQTGKVKLGVSVKNSVNGLATSDISWTDEEFPLGETVLVVLHYVKGSGSNDDTASLFINPTADVTAPDATSKGQEETLMDIRGIAVSQRTKLLGKSPEVIIDEVRVATTMEDLFSASSDPVVVPNITIEGSSVDFGQIYTGVTYTRDVTIKGTNLTDDITITLGESGQITTSVNVIPKDEAMSEDGYTLSVNLTPQESRFFSDRITLSSEGALDRVINLEWHPVSAFVSTTLAGLANQDTGEDNYEPSLYVYTGQATVTFIETYYDLSYDRVVNSIFCQDATGGVELRSALGCGYEEIDITGVKVGDNLTNIAGYLIFGGDGLTMVPRTPTEWEIASHDNEIEPIDLTLRQLAMAADGYVYCNQLVRVTNVRFLDDYYWAGDYHGLWNAQKYQIFDGTLDEYDGLAWMWCNKGAEYFKTSTAGYFDHTWTLTGILNSYYPIHISPRAFADFEDLGQREMSGVENISTEDANQPAEYFNLQGVRVDNPENGLYICRRGNTTTKVLVP